MLLQETELSPSEQEHVMGGIVEGMRELEADYLRAVDQHAEDQRRASIATDGAISATQEFDPDRSMEADILRCCEACLRSCNERSGSLFLGAGI